MHPLARNTVIAIVGLLIAGGLVALGLLTTDPGVSITTLIAGGLVAAAVGLFLFVQGWIWSFRAHNRGRPGRAVLIALSGGSMILLTGLALAGTVILAVSFR